MPTEPYTTGTVAVTAGSATATGTGVAWLPAIVTQGDMLLVPAQNAFGIVDSVDNTDTIITLFSPWTGATVQATVTITTSGTAVVTWNNHNRQANEGIEFSGLTLTGLANGTTYYVVGSSITTNTFELSATPGGSALTTSGTQSGTITATVVSFAYLLLPSSWQRYDPALTQSQTRAMLALIANSQPMYTVTGAAPDPGVGENGQFAIKINAGGWLFWQKQTGAWVLLGSPLGITPLGQWSSITTYAVNDVVSYPLTGAASSYISLAPSTNVPPGTDPTTWALLASAGANGNAIDYGTGAPSSGIGNNNDFYIDTAASKLYGPKAAGAWPAGVSLIGATGPAGANGTNGTNGVSPVIGGTSTSSVTAGTGAQTFVTQSGLSWQVGQRLIATSADLSISLSGLVSSYTSGTLVLSVDRATGTGTAASWTISVSGIPGTNGISPIIQGTSTTTITAGTGSKTFVTQSGLSWQTGQRLIATSADLSISLSGLVSSYSGAALTLNVDEATGAGNAASWTISVSGNQGPQGASGGPGPAGSQGPAPIIAGTSSSTVAVGTGSQTFSTQVGIAWSFAQRLRIASSDTSKVMEGTLSSYSGSTLTVNVDTVVGSGSASSWFISIAGEKGDQGAQGIQGNAGQGIQPNATGTLAQRSTYDNQPQGFAYLETDISPFQLFVKNSNTTADWSSGNPIGGNIPIGDLGLVSQSVTQSFDLGMVG